MKKMFYTDYKMQKLATIVRLEVIKHDPSLGEK